jgi:hypothetical protein
VACRFAAPRSPGLLAAAIIFVDGCPGPAFGLLLRNPTLLVAFGYMVGLALLLVFVAAGHDNPPVQFSLNEKLVKEFTNRGHCCDWGERDADERQRTSLRTRSMLSVPAAVIPVYFILPVCAARLYVWGTGR